MKYFFDIYITSLYLNNKIINKHAASLAIRNSNRIKKTSTSIINQKNIFIG
jgi:hypothetical protein